MPVRAVFIRMIAYGLVLGALDAIGGRLLQASPDPSQTISLGAAAWASFVLARSGQSRIAIPAGLTLWLTYFLSFLASAAVLVGWNGSVRWRIPSTNWLVMFAVWAIIAAVMAQFFGVRAAQTSASGKRPDAAPNN